MRHCLKASPRIFFIKTQHTNADNNHCTPQIANESRTNCLIGDFLLEASSVIAPAGAFFVMRNVGLF
jgi:hypothetical protein